jgi:hypothetical protein
MSLEILNKWFKSVGRFRGRRAEIAPSLLALEETAGSTLKWSMHVGADARQVDASDGGGGMSMIFGGGDSDRSGSGRLPALRSKFVLAPGCKIGETGRSRASSDEADADDDDVSLV